MSGITLKFKTVLLFSLTVTAGVLLILFSEPAANGVIKGLSLSFNTVVPSLFLFTALSLFLFSSGCVLALGRFISPLSSRVFGLDGEQFAVLILSFVSGYPVGARLIDDLYKRERITKQKANIMLRFCTNAGPAFLINTVGAGMLRSESDGIRLFLASVLSSFTLLIFSVPCLKKYDKSSLATKVSSHPPLSDVFVSSVSKASSTMLGITAFIVFFSGLGAVLSALALPHSLKTVITSLLEVTNGVGLLSRKDLPLCGFLISFGGISVILQVVSSAENIKPSILKITLWRIMGGGLSALYVLVFEKICPRTNLVSNILTQPSVGWSGGKFDPLFTAALLLMAVTLVASTSKTHKHNT